MSAPSAARRVRVRFMSVGFWTAAVAFVVIEGDALLDQSEIGHASPLFMFGTACLAAAACIALFAIITAIGLMVSAAFEEAPHRQQPRRGRTDGHGSSHRPVPKTAACNVGSRTLQVP
jgi:hypothetical protein